MRSVRAAKLDEADHAILARLQHNSRIVAEVIGAEVGLSTAAVQRRIKRLRENGVISREVAVLDPGALGQAMTFLVSVQLERENAEFLDTFGNQMRADENVQQCYCVAGECDFILVVLARDMAEFDTFTRRPIFRNPHIRRLTTNVVMSRTKVGLTVPLS